jgi:hypothetical protein
MRYFPAIEAARTSTKNGGVFPAASIFDVTENIT